MNQPLDETTDYANFVQSQKLRSKLKEVEKFLRPQSVGFDTALRKVDPFTEFIKDDKMSQALKAYILLSRSLESAAADPTNTIRAKYAVAASKLKSARIFSFPRLSFLQLYRAADIFTTQTFGNAEWTPTEKVGKDFDAKQFFRTVHKHGTIVPMPERMPFENIFITFDENVMLSDEQVYARIGREPKNQHDRYYHCGYLVCDDGNVLELIVGLNIVGDDLSLPGKITDSVIFQPFTREADLRVASIDGSLQVGGWTRPFNLNPWICTSFIDLINSYRSFVHEESRSFSVQRSFEKACKGLRVKRSMPPPFYTVRMEQELIVEHLTSRFPRQSSTKPEYKYRWDVRGHERVRFRRGDLPLDPKLEAILLRKGYKLFTLNQPDFDTWRLIAERHLEPKRPNEWLAVKRCWVESHTKGPEGAPYIPAIRKPTGLGS